MCPEFGKMSGLSFKREVNKGPSCSCSNSLHSTLSFPAAGWMTLPAADASVLLLLHAAKLSRLLLFAVNAVLLLSLLG